MSSYGGQHLLSGAQNVKISGGTFNFVNSASNSIRFGLSHLLQNISQGAFHNAAERGSPPRCHPHTRKAIRAEIMEWIKAPSSMRKLILWMYGPAGAGKTAIAQSIAEECEQQGLIAASFFFWRTADGRNDASRFVATLAYQLSRYIPQLEDPILTSIEQDPAILSRSLSAQMQALVIAPLKFVGLPLPTPIFVIVDGFDECGPNGQSQSDLLHLLGAVALELRHIPLIFLITSRPEYEIRREFNGPILNPLLKVLVLDNSYKPDEDIKHYFDSTFREIYREHHQLGRHLPLPWPTASDITFLVSKASGQFIFAATVLKFINSPRHNPVNRLNIILRLSKDGNETPFALLDALYLFILDSVVDINRVLEILTLLLLAGDYKRVFSLYEAEDLLGFEIHSALIDMHSLLFVPARTDNKLPRIHHASLSDFLTDLSRSRKYYIDARQGHGNLCGRWLKVIGTHPQSRTMQNRVAEILDDLACLDLTTSLEGISDLEKDLHFPDWENFFTCVKKQGENCDEIYPRLQKAFDTFILNRIAQYPLSLRNHIPILLCLRSQGEALFMSKTLFRGACESTEELDKLHKLDMKLLDILAIGNNIPVNEYFGELMQDKSRAGKYLVDGGRYAALAKVVVGVICAKPEQNHWPLWTEQIGSNHLCAAWYPSILENASIDLDLANFLGERAVQFRKGMPGLRLVAEASVKYIQRCGIPSLVHVHQSDLNACGICLWHNGISAAGSTSLYGPDTANTTGPQWSSIARKPTTIGPVLVKDPTLPPRKRFKPSYE